MRKLPPPPPLSPTKKKPLFSNCIGIYLEHKIHLKCQKGLVLVCRAKFVWKTELVRQMGVQHTDVIHTDLYV